MQGLQIGGLFSPLPESLAWRYFRYLGPESLRVGFSVSAWLLSGYLQRSGTNLSPHMYTLCFTSQPPKSINVAEPKNNHTTVSLGIQPSI